MNLNLAIDTTNFKPFDISPALQILHDYRDAYQKLEEILDKIAQEKGLYVLPEGSSYRNTMDRYNADYNAVVEDFNKGLNYRNRAAIRDLRRRYYEEIEPINKAAESYNKHLDTVSKLRVSDPTAIIGQDYKIEDFYGGINPDLKYKSGKLVEADSAKYFSGISNALMKDPLFKSILGSQYYLQVLKGGLDSKDALMAALTSYLEATGGKNQKEVGELLDHMNKLFSAQGVSEYSNSAKEEVWNRIGMGLIDSITEPKYNIHNNRDFESTAEKKQRELQEAATKVQMEENGWVYNKETKEYEWNQDAYNKGLEHIKAKYEATHADPAILPPVVTVDGTNYVLGEDKKYHEEGTQNSVGRTMAQLVQLDNSKKANKKLSEARQAAKKGNYTPYLEIGKSFKPMTFTARNMLSSWSEKDYDASLGMFSSGYRDSAWYGSNNKFTDDLKANFLENNQEEANNVLSLILTRSGMSDLSWDDLDIWVDKDWFSNNEYKVVIKGTGEMGNYEVPTLENNGLDWTEVSSEVETEGL